MYIHFEYISFKNFLSYPATETKFEFKKGFNLLTAKNGEGKCLDPLTNIDIIIEDENILKKFKEYRKNNEK